MCGILTYIAAPSDRITALVTSGLANQHNRGMDGAGYILIPHWRAEKPIVRRFLSPFHAIPQLQKDVEEQADRDGLCTVAFHHRMPTSTANVEHCNHPIQSGNSYLIHNGIIFNSHALKPKHEKAGIAYTTLHAEKFNDSEALAHDVTLALKKPKQNKHGVSYRLKSQGSFAFVRYDAETRTLIYGRNDSSPLQFTTLENGTMALCSQADGSLALLKEWNAIPARKLYMLNIESMMLDTARFTHGHYSPPTIKTYAGMSGYPSAFPSSRPRTVGFDGWETWDDFDDIRGAPPAKTQAAIHFDNDDMPYVPAKYRAADLEKEEERERRRMMKEAGIVTD